MDRYKAAAVVLAVLVLAGCGRSGTGSGAGSATSASAVATGTGAASPVSSAHGRLSGVEWQLTQVRENGQAWSPDAAVAVKSVIRLNGTGKMTGQDGCNYFGAPVRVTAAALTVGTVEQTEMLCLRNARVVQAMHKVLTGAVGWRVVGSQLVLTKQDAATLVFTVKRSVFPTDSGRPLLQRTGSGGGEYRLSWRLVTNGEVALTWVWRVGPGEVWGTSGISGGRSTPGVRPEPADGDAGDRAFVFGVIAAPVTRVVFQPAGGRPVQQLRMFTLTGASGLRAYGGFVTGRKADAVVIAYDAAGRELGRSVSLHWS